MASQAPALAEGPQPTGEDAPASGELSSSLDRFVQNAIDEGLLTPSAKPGSETQAAPQSPSAAPAPEPRAPGEPARIVALRPKHAIAEAVCANGDPFDFSGFHDLRNYDDLLAWRRGAESGFSSSPDVPLAKAYIALGLNEEARLQLDGVAGADASALRRLAYLMEDRAQPELDFFREQAACPGASDLWYALALAQSAPGEAAKRLEANINAFRRLPFQLRVEVASKAIPALDASGDRFVAEKMMANFTEQEIQASSRLIFNKALMAMQTGGQPAEYAMRNYLNMPEFRAAATASLLRHGYSLEPSAKQDAADRIVDELNDVSSAAAVSDNLDMMLDELEGVAGYGLTLQLAGLPATQTPEARARVTAHFAALADDGLSSPDLYDNLEAMDALLRGASLLAGREEGEELFADAARLAIDLGWQTLATTFAARVSDPEELAEARASLAYRTLDHETVKTLAAEYPKSPHINRLAALSAVRAGDGPLMLRVAARFDPDPETLLDMVELDAASRAWILPQRFYTAAESLEGEAARKRVSRVNTLRAQRGGPPPAPAFRMAEIGTALDRIGQSLDPNAEGAF